MSQNNRGHKLEPQEHPPTKGTTLLLPPPLESSINSKETGVCRVKDSSISAILSGGEAVALALQTESSSSSSSLWSLLSSLKNRNDNNDNNNDNNDNNSKTKSIRATEENFLKYCKLHSANKELSFTEVRLLYYGFMVNEQSDNDTKTNLSSSREAFKMPKRISESLRLMSVRDALAAGPLLQLEKALMSLVEDYHRRTEVSFSRLLQLLDRFLLADVVVGDDGDDGNNIYGGGGNGIGIGNGNGIGNVNDVSAAVDDNGSLENNNKEIIAVIALLRNQVNVSQQYKDLLMECRGGIIRAKDYGHLIGRFLIGREERCGGGGNRNRNRSSSSRRDGRNRRKK